MTFGHPLAFVLLLVAVPIVVVYRLRVRWRSEAVATNMFWDQVFAERPARSHWQPWRDRASLAAQLAIVVLAVMALAEPQIPRPQQTVVILDNSAGMSATDVEPSRLAVAKETTLRLVEGMRDYDEMAVLTTGGHAAVCSTFTTRQDLLREVLEAVQGTSGLTGMQEALALARQTFAAQARGKFRIVVLSDGCFPGAADLTAQGIELIRVGTHVGNAAIVRFAARRTLPDPQVCQVFVETMNHSDQAATGSLALVLDGKTIDSAQVAMAANGRWQHVFETKVPSAGRLVARLEPADACAADNEAVAVLPPIETTAVCGAGVSPASGSRDGCTTIDLRAPSDLGIDAAELVAGCPWPPVWLYPAALALGLLVLEWYLYQRRWMS